MANDCAFTANQTDWQEIMKSHDLVWNAMPDRWADAPHLGNALLGSMLYARDGAVSIELFRADVQDHRDQTHGWTAYSRPRYPVGRLILRLAGTPRAAEMELDIWNAELTGELHTDRGDIAIAHFVHAEEPLFITEVRAAGEETGCTWQWHSAQAEPTRPGHPTNTAELAEYGERYGSQYKDPGRMTIPYQPNPVPRRETTARYGARIELCRQDLVAGEGHAMAWRECYRVGVRRFAYSRPFPMSGVM